eukprot:6254104-Pyramimonas_sp.AAC.1
MIRSRWETYRPRAGEPAAVQRGKQKPGMAPDSGRGGGGGGKRGKRKITKRTTIHSQARHRV